MLIHPWDATVDEQEWRAWLDTGERFGALAIPHMDLGCAPFVVPTHFTIGDGKLLLHLAKPNPVWPHILAAREVRLAVTSDYAYIPSTWRAKAGGPDEDGVPTSYYASVQFVCSVEVVDEAEEKAEILRRQLADVQPEGGHQDVSTTEGRYARMLPGLRGLRLHILSVDAKFKYDDHNPIEHRERVAVNLDARGRGLDRGAARQQRRRLDAMGDWELRKG